MCTPALLCLVLNTLLVSLLVERMGGKGNENHARSFFTTVGASRHHDECFRSHPPCCGEGHQEGDGSVCQQHNFCALPVPQPAGASQTLAHEPHISYYTYLISFSDLSSLYSYSPLSCDHFLKMYFENNEPSGFMQNESVISRCGCVWVTNRFVVQNFM